MEDKKESYFGEIGGALKTLATGLKTTMKEYFTPKSTEQYPENRKTTLHVSKRHRGRLVFVRDENGNHKCVACTMCEKACPNGTITITHEMVENPETGKKKRQLIDYQYDLGECMFCQLCVNACNFGAIKFNQRLRKRRLRPPEARVPPRQGGLQRRQPAQPHRRRRRLASGHV